MKWYNDTVEKRGRLNMKKTVIGILAHVDAGKTTLSESMLYLSGSIKSLGRVDHQNAFLDYDHQEQGRGITIYAKQAVFQWKDCEITLIDTPGHIDFSAEMERTLQVLDYAIVLISGLDGIQAHTKTIWKLLKYYQIPAFLFVNKMDITHIEKAALMCEIEQQLDHSCIDFTLNDSERDEKISLCNDELLEHYATHMHFSKEKQQQIILNRQIFPCFFGSALKLINIDMLLDAISLYTIKKTYPEKFGALVYKITHDDHENQLTHMKITGGSLKVKQRLANGEKVDQIRQYSGLKYQSLKEVFAGSVCAVKGLHHVFVNEGLGIEQNAKTPMLSSCMQFSILKSDNLDMYIVYKHLKQLAKEDPQLHVHYHEKSQEITIQLMGEIQTEVIKKQMFERFGLQIEFNEGSIVYRESIAEAVEGIGHYEPLAHYAEVHLLLEPNERGRGIEIANQCSEDVLSLHWQKQILSHIEAKEHIGVLTGSPITDIKITLLAGKAHLKHTESADFMQAVSRAIRQGLKSAKSILLEPYYHFHLEIPNAYVSKAIYDIDLMQGSYQIQNSTAETVLINGNAPVSKMRNYQTQVLAYTKGKGKLFYTLYGYRECKDAKKIIDACQYDSEGDLDNPTGSIFFTHGAGYYVKWDEVNKHMHIGYCWQQNKKESAKLAHHPVKIEDTEMEKIMTKIYGPDQTKLHHVKENHEESSDKITYIDHLPHCLLVDGYNMIYSWNELKELAKDNLDAAREKLIHMMSSYQGYKKCLLILVFDAYKVADGIGSQQFNGSIYIVYTKKSQTADSYIESAVHKLSSNYQISVATSDGMEQLIVSAQGARRISSRELEQEILYLNKTKMKEYQETHKKGYARPLAAIKQLNEDE